MYFYRKDIVLDKEKDISKFLEDKPELGFIIEVLSKPSSITNLFDDFKSDLVKQSINNFNHEEFIRLIKHHRLDSIFYKAVKEQNIELPQKLDNKLAKIDKANRMRMMKLTAELIRIHQLFTENGIDYISLKGPTLSQQIYGDYTVRRSKDLDILIKEENINKVYEIFKKEGFKARSRNSNLKRLSDKDQVFYSENGIMIELHYRLFNNKFLLPYSDKLLSKPDYSIINKQKIPILPRWFYLLYQIGHSASHNWSRMVWSLDVIYFNNQLSPKELTQSSNYAEQVGISRIYEQAKNIDLYRFIKISNEAHYHFFKKFTFLLSLNANRDYKKHEILQRLLIPYRFFIKYLV